MTYKINGKVIDNLAEFQKVRVNDSEKLKNEYDQELNKINREEKKLDMQKTQMQTELTALTTEEQSIKSIIDKNVERGFSLWS